MRNKLLKSCSKALLGHCINPLLIVLVYVQEKESFTILKGCAMQSFLTIEFFKKKNIDSMFELNFIKEIHERAIIKGRLR
jgi:hypothetical protein